LPKFNQFVGVVPTFCAARTFLALQFLHRRGGFLGHRSGARGSKSKPKDKLLRNGKSSSIIPNNRFGDAFRARSTTRRTAPPARRCCCSAIATPSFPKGEASLRRSRWRTPWGLGSELLRHAAAAFGPARASALPRVCRNCAPAPSAQKGNVRAKTALKELRCRRSTTR
jgi:hypothetical protein